MKRMENDPGKGGPPGTEGKRGRKLCAKLRRQGTGFHGHLIRTSRLAPCERSQGFWTAPQIFP
jgi:hypothetical protein